MSYGNGDCDGDADCYGRLVCRTNWATYTSESDWDSCWNNGEVPNSCSVSYSVPAGGSPASQALLTLVGTTVTGDTIDFTSSTQ